MVRNARLAAEGGGVSRGGGARKRSAAGGHFADWIIFSWFWIQNFSQTRIPSASPVLTVISGDWEIGSGVWTSGYHSALQEGPESPQRPENLWRYRHWGYWIGRSEDI